MLPVDFDQLSAADATNNSDFIILKNTVNKQELFEMTYNFAA